MMEDFNIMEYLDKTGVAYKEKGYDRVVLEAHDSLTITPSRNLFNWFSRGIGGYGVWDFIRLVEYEGQNVSKRDIMQRLIDVFGEDRCGVTDWDEGDRKRPKPVLHEAKYQVQSQPQNTIEFALPEKNRSVDLIRKYLCEERGISEKVFNEFVSRGLLYESNIKITKNRDGTDRSKPFYAHNAVFVRIDPRDGNIKAATVKGSYVDPTTHKRYSRDVPGSNKFDCLFYFQGKNVKEPDHVILFEAEIDLMSYLSLQEEKGVSMDNFVCVSLGGISADMTIRASLQHLFDRFPTIKKVMISFDNDYDKELMGKINVGREAMVSLHQNLIQAGKKPGWIFVRDGDDGTRCKDWNDCLLEYRKGNWTFLGQGKKQDNEPDGNGKTTDPKKDTPDDDAGPGGQ